MLSSSTSRRLPTGSTPDFVGGYSLGWVGTTSEKVVSLTALTGGLASAPAEDDIVIVAYGLATAETFEGDAAMSATGYATLADVYLGGGSVSYAPNLLVAWKKMTATPDTSVTLSAGLSANDGGAVSIHVWRGQNLTDPWGATIATATGESSKDAKPPLIFAPTVGSIILCCGMVAADGGGVSTASYLSNFFSAYGNDNAYDASIGLGSVVAMGGNYNPAAFSGGGFPSGPNWAAATMVLKGA